MKRGAALAAAAAAGALGVAAGAFGAHALREALDPAARAVYETAGRYHLVHAVAMLALACAPDRLWQGRWPGRACAAWLAGVVLFSGSLYAIAAGAPRWLGAITPLSGVAFVAGWVAAGLAARAPRGPQPPDAG